jgi:threonine dehydrogenase-like Zn-dependent dehydrogenase
MPIEVRAIVFTAPGNIELRCLDLPECGPDQIIAQTIFSFVSPGTELRVLGGHLESRDKFPLIPGYSWVGKVIQAGSALRGWREGQLVTGRNPLPLPGINSLWGGQASHHRCHVSGENAVLKLPDGADPWDYVAVEVGAIAWRGTSIAMPVAGQTAVVVGQGVVGLLAARWLVRHGLRVIVTDLHEQRLTLSKRMGVAAAIQAGRPDSLEEIRSWIPHGADVAVEVSGHIDGARLASALLREPWPGEARVGYPSAMPQSLAPFPRLVLLSTYADTTPLPPSGVLSVEGALVLKPADRTHDDRLAVIEQIRQGQFKTSWLLSDPTPVADAPQAYHLLRDQANQITSLCFAW